MLICDRYSELQIEASEYIEPRPPKAWPDKGEILVENLVIRYAPDLPDVLHGLTFHVDAQEKIGLVGATGCGKSTLSLSFFRFVEATQGRIVIDGIGELALVILAYASPDISKIGLTDLRSQVTIIPQDPMILSGTIRSALDVFDEYDDADIYAALKRVHLLKEGDAVEDEEINKNVFRDLSNPVRYVDASIRGLPFRSQRRRRQLFERREATNLVRVIVRGYTLKHSMARAILRRNRLILMDEATASIDCECWSVLIQDEC